MYLEKMLLNNYDLRIHPLPVQIKLYDLCGNLLYLSVSKIHVFHMH